MGAVVALKWTLVVVLAAALLVTAIVAALAAYGSSQWAERSRGLLAQLEGARVPPPVTRYDSARELAGLPAPVQRYFRVVLTEGQPIITAATVQHRGTFNMSENGERWIPFTSTQRITTRRTGFLWNAQMSMFPIVPGLNVHVHDAYISGEGLLHPALLGLVSLVKPQGTPELAQGELMRWFAEAAWYPTALLPGQGVRWEAIDEQSARATLADGAVSVTLTFGFAADGTMQSVRAETRGRTVAGQVVMTPWEGRWSDVQVRGGMRVPLSGEVAWLTPQGRRPYWRGTISSIEFELAP